MSSKKKNPRAAAMERNQAKDEENQRKAQLDLERKEAESWKDGSDERSLARQREAEEKSNAKQAKKSEMAALLAQEEDMNSSVVKKKAAKKKGKDDFDLLNEALAKAPKTKAQIAREEKLRVDEARRKTEEDNRIQKEERLKVEEAQKLKAASKGVVIEDMLSIKPNNRLESDFADASGLDSALDLLHVGDDEDDAHPERRQKAMHMAFYERMLPIMKEEHPGLKLSQYKERIFDMWRVSPENPRSQHRMG